MSYDSSLQAKQCQILLTALHQHKYCDVTFVIGSQQTSFEANRIFLSLISPVFDAMLRESEPDSEIIIESADPEAFKCVLMHAHCNDPGLNQDNVVEVARLADKYRIELLQVLCTSYFRSILETQNVCAIC